MTHKNNKKGAAAKQECAHRRSAPDRADLGKLDYWIRKYAWMADPAQEADGRVDVLRAVGGWFGVAKNVIPGLGFIVVFMVNPDLFSASAIAIGVGAVFVVISLVRGESLLTSVSGLLGVILCAFMANRSGEGRDYYVPGFYMTGAALLVFSVLLFCRFPIAGVLYGYIRGEGLQWRRQPSRYRRYYWATIIIIMIFVLRLAVQLPLYFLGEEAIGLLGTMRLAMGIPLYAAGLWLAWLVSLPSSILPEHDRVEKKDKKA